MALTDLAIKRTKPGTRDIWLTEDARRGEARLTLRITPAGNRIFYLRYTNSAGKRELLPLGVYDPTGKKGLSLKMASEKAGSMKVLYQQGVKDLKRHLELEARRQKEEAERRNTETFGALLDAYVESLDGKVSQANVRSLLRVHVHEAFPELCRLPASEITPSDIRDILAAIIKQGKERTAGKVRAFLSAAYNQAIRAVADPTTPMRSSGFFVEHNPVAAVPSLSHFTRAGHRVLTWEELDAYHRALLAHQGNAVQDALLVALYLGGQRITQLLRLQPEHVDVGSGTLTLFDTKGRRQHPRPHVLPIIEPVAAILERRLALGDPWVFSGNGKIPVHPCTPSDIVRGISKGDYSLRDIRRTCETRMAEMGIGKDLRAQIQSHGLGGVQDRHYDRHDYLPEKRRALETWTARLLGSDAESVVVPFREAGTVRSARME